MRFFQQDDPEDHHAHHVVYEHFLKYAHPVSQSIGKTLVQGEA